MNEFDENTDFTLYILNEKNKLITKKFLTDLFKKYGVDYKVKDLGLFQMAMTHKSYIVRDFSNDREREKIMKQLKDVPPIDDPSFAIPLQNQSYERLEFRGDSRLHDILADYLYERYPDRDEGFLTKLRTKIENGETLANLARILGLHQYVLIARNIELSGGRSNNDHIFEDAFESLIGAFFYDSNKDYKLIEKFVINVIESHIDFADLIYNETNYKDLLLQYHHRMKWPDPEYGLIDIVEKNEKKYFNMYVKGNNGVTIGTGLSSAKKKAEQLAAKNALYKFKVLNDDSDDEETIYEIN